MKKRNWMLGLALAGALLGGPAALAEKEEAAPDAAAVLAKVDAALFFPDTQEGLLSYECDVKATTKMRQGLPDRESAEPLGRVRVVIAEGARTWVDAAGKAVAPGAWTPACGPWTLTNVVRLETELFFRPLSKRFAEPSWERKAEADGDGWRLVLTPKEPLADPPAAPLCPAVTRLELLVGKDSIPTGGVLGLDQGLFRVDAPFRLEFAFHGTRQRIAAFTNTIASGNAEIHPALLFAWSPQGDFDFPLVVTFSVPGGDLSPLMSGPMPMDIASSLLFEDYAITPVPR